MKNLIYILLLFCLWGTPFCECRDQEDSLRDVEVEEMYDYDFENDIQISSVKEALDYVASNMTYKNEENDYWQLPEQSYQWKTGDCEDYCILFMYLLKTKLDIDSELILVVPNKNIVHTVVKYNNQYSDPTMYDIKSGLTNIYVPESHIRWKAPYEEVIWMTYNYHDNVGKYY